MTVNYGGFGTRLLQRFHVIDRSIKALKSLLVLHKRSGTFMVECRLGFLDGQPKLPKSIKSNIFIFFQLLSCLNRHGQHPQNVNKSQLAITKPAIQKKEKGSVSWNGLGILGVRS